MTCLDADARLIRSLPTAARAGDEPYAEAIRAAARRRR